jgi:predicted phosphodiesterase
VRLAVLADIHGNAHALTAVLADVETQSVDQVIVLGDLADRGPDPVTCIERVQAAADVCIKGNTDGYVLDLADGQADPEIDWLAQYAPTRWTADRLKADQTSYLWSLPDQHVLHFDELPDIRLVHGSPRRADEAITADGSWGLRVDDALRLIDEPVLLFGHTHLPLVYQSGERLTVNPCSVGQPFNDDPRAQYAILSGADGGWQVEQRAVDYDRAALAADYESSGFLEAANGFGRAAMLTSLTGHNVLLDFLRHIRDVARTAGANPSRVPDALYRQASASFDWASQQAG